MTPLLNNRQYRMIARVVPYLLAVFLTILTTLALYLLRTSINPTIIALLYLLPVGFSTAAWGLGAGITSALVAFLTFNYFFIKPYYTLIVHQSQDLLVLFAFLVIAVVISQLVGRAQRSLAQATAREQDAVRLYEFSALLAGLHSESEIIKAITEQTQDVFQASRVEIFVEASKDNPEKPSQTPAFQPPPPSEPARSLARIQEAGSAPDLIVPLQSTRGLLGEIRLWRADPPVTPEEERLLRTFASQGVLAIERSRLLLAETRAQVLEESDRLKSSLLSSVSHELRTPLATIKAAVSSLRSETVEWDSEARSELLEAVDEETDHLNQLVENLLNMSRIEAGVLKPLREWNSLEEIIAGVVKRFNRPVQLERADLPPSHHIELDLPDDLPLVPVDYVQMEQVFTNLISNSMKYSPAGSLIFIRAWVVNAEQIQVQVVNQGPPVPEEHLERIFDKFYRITATEKVTGTGLGLSICKGIILAHGGKIWAENQADGFSYNFALPRTWGGEQPHLPAGMINLELPG